MMILQCLLEKTSFLDSEDLIDGLRLAIANYLSKSLVHEAEFS